MFFDIRRRAHFKTDTKNNDQIIYYLYNFVQINILTSNKILNKTFIFNIRYCNDV